VHTLLQRVAWEDLRGAASGSKSLKRYLQCGRPFFIDVSEVAVAVKTATLPPAQHSQDPPNAPSLAPTPIETSLVYRVEIRLVGALDALRRCLKMVALTDPSLQQPASTSSRNTLNTDQRAGDRQFLFPGTIRFASEPPSAISLNAGAEILQHVLRVVFLYAAQKFDKSRPLLALRGAPVTLSGPSSQEEAEAARVATAAATLLYLAAHSEASRRRLAAVVTELACRGHDAIATAVAAWCPHTVRRAESPALVHVAPLQQRQGQQRQGGVTDEHMDVDEGASLSHSMNRPLLPSQLSVTAASSVVGWDLPFPVSVVPRSIPLPTPTSSEADLIKHPHLFISPNFRMSLPPSAKERLRGLHPVLLCLQQFVVFGYTSTALGQRLVHPAAVVQYALLLPVMTTPRRPHAPLNRVVSTTGSHRVRSSSHASAKAKGSQATTSD
jgi:hypothetical protein